MLRATTACYFSSLLWPAGSAPAALASLLFDPPEPKSLEKHSVSRLSYLFAHLHLLSSYSVSSTLLSSNLSLLSASSLLCFSSVHIVGSLTSKLPSTIYSIHGSYGLAKMKQRATGGMSAALSLASALHGRPMLLASWQVGTVFSPTLSWDMSPITSNNYIHGYIMLYHGYIMLYHGFIMLFHGYIMLYHGYIMLYHGYIMVISCYIMVISCYIMVISYLHNRNCTRY